MHPEYFDRRCIIAKIESCITTEQIDSCRGWVDDLFRRKILKSQTTMDVLYEIISIKYDNIVSNPQQKHTVLPHLKKTADRMATDEARSNIKLVKTLCCD